MNAESSPICFIINTKSGGRAGMQVKEHFSRFRDCITFDVKDFWKALDVGSSNPEMIRLTEILQDDRVRVVVAGGDGTVSFVCALIERIHKEITEMRLRDDMDETKSKRQRFMPPVAILPIGVGNELSRCIGWSSSFTPSYGYCLGDSESTFVNDVRRGQIINLDMWNVHIETPNRMEDTIVELEGDNLRSEERFGRFAMLCFFSIGFDANIAHQFHLRRERSPSLTSRVAANKAWYTYYGIKELFSRKMPISDLLEVRVDGQLVSLPPNIRTIQVLNIHSSADGVDFFGVNDRSNPSELQYFNQPTLGDGLFELVGTEGVMHLMKIRMKISHSRRIAQGRDIKITLLAPLAAQLDGEAWIQMPCTIHITHHRKVSMVRGFGTTKSIGLYQSEILKTENNEVQPLLIRSREHDN